jgi:hypothetical protein
MDEVKRPQKDSSSGALVFKSISLHATRYTLWSKTSTGEPTEFLVSSIIPCFKLSNSFKNSLQRFFRDLKKHPSSSPVVSASPALFNPQEIDLITVTSLPTSSNDLFFPLIQSQSFDKSHYESAIEKISSKVENFEEFEVLTVLDLCIPFFTFQVQGNALKLLMHLVLPSVSFNMQPISSLKLVSTSLCQNLAKKERRDFSAGFMAVDAKMRLLPLKLADKNVLKYPLVGVWATGCRDDFAKDGNLWALFVRFVETVSVKERISLNPPAGSFIFTNFAQKIMFYEITFNGKPAWKVISKAVSASAAEVRFGDDGNFGYFRSLREKKSFTASTTSSEGRYSRVRGSFESSSTEKMIMKQNEKLRSLEKQINLLQHALSEPKLVNAETNTTSYFKDSNRISTRRLSNEIRTSVEGFRGNPLRNSCNVEIRHAFVDGTINVPKIIYKPDSESDEELSLELNQHF